MNRINFNMTMAKNRKNQRIWGNEVLLYSVFLKQYKRDNLHIFTITKIIETQ